MGSKEIKKNEKIRKAKIKVIGIGGGGGNIVSEIATKIKRVSFVVANTDLQALKVINKKVIRFPFSQSFTQERERGMDVELVYKVTDSEKEKIKNLLKGQNLCLIIACLGGKTGSGAAPIFAKISKKLGNLTYGIFTLPFNFEGEKRMKLAEIAIEKLRPQLNAITIVPNEKIFQTIDKDTSLKETFSYLNKNLAESLSGLIETIYQPGLINIDFADLKTILEGWGKLTYLNTIEIKKKEGLTQDLIKKLLNCPLYAYTIQGAKGVLFNVIGEKNLELSEISQISKNIFELVNKDAKIIFGISPNKKNQDIIKTMILATGCGAKIFNEKSNKNLRKKIKKPKQKIEPKEKSEPKKIKTKRNSLSILSLPVMAIEEKIRKNGLEIKKEIEEIEEEILKEEKKWEAPTFLRKNINYERSN